MKKLSWEIISDFLKSELKQTKHIMTWGTIGSLNIEHDIDTIITKKPSVPSSEFFKEIHTIFENLDSYLYKNFKTKAVRFGHSTQEYLVKGYTKEKKVLFHTMIYVSFPEVEEDWSWALFKDERIEEILGKHYKCILGKTEDIFSKEFRKENYFENIFINLYAFDSLNSNLPRKVFLEVMNGCFKYLYKKKLGIEAPIAKNREEVKKYFYELCDLLDKLNKEKQTKNS